MTDREQLGETGSGRGAQRPTAPGDLQIGEPDTPSVDQLRRAFAALTEEGALAPDGEHPPAETIWRARRGDFTAAERLAVIDHLSGCPSCALAWRLAGALPHRDGALPHRDGAQPQPKAAPWPPRRRVVAPHRRRLVHWFTGVAAALALAIAGLAFWFPQDGLRGGAEHVERHRGEATPLQLQLPADGTLPRNGFTLRWQGPAADGLTYTVRLYTPDFTLLDEWSEIDGRSLEVTVERLPALGQLERIVIELEAVQRDGEPAAHETFSVPLR